MVKTLLPDHPDKGWSQFVAQRSVDAVLCSAAEWHLTDTGGLHLAHLQRSSVLISISSHQKKGVGEDGEDLPPRIVFMA